MITSGEKRHTAHRVQSSENFHACVKLHERHIGSAFCQARQQQGRGKFSRSPRRLGAPPSLKNIK